MTAKQSIGSILVADCGTVMTKVVLLDRVGGSYRFVARGEAPSTVEAPWHDILLGVQHATEQIEEVTGHMLLDQGGNLVVPQDESVGVDAFVALVSSAEPVQVVLAGLVRGMSLASGERAVLETYSRITGIISRDLTRGWMSEEEQIAMILDRQPEVVCIVGGTDSGATTPVLELVEAAALGCSMIEDEEERPRILFAGNKDLRQRVVKMVGGRTDVRPTENVHPVLNPDVENPLGVRSELEALYAEQKLTRLPGVELVQHWSTLPLTPTAKAFSELIRYLWHLEESAQEGVLGVDIGGAHTTVAAMFGGRLRVTVAGGLGAVFAGRRLLDGREPIPVTRWLPYPLEAEAARASFINREMRPWSLPQEAEELLLDQAVAREALRETLRIARPGWQAGDAQLYPNLTPALSPILLSGGVLVNAPRPAQAALIALDAIEPIGVTTLLLDRHRLAPALGGVARLKPLATVEALDNGGVVNLATVVAPVGKAREGDQVLRVRIKYEQGGAFQIEVPYGSLEVLPLQPGQEAVVELRPRRGFDVGMGPGKGGQRRVRGSLVGLVIDARGRPLDLPQDTEECRDQIQRWLRDIGG